MFLEKPRSAWIAENELAFAIWDGFPVTAGHALVITKRLVPTWFEASAEERVAIFALVDEVVERIEKDHEPRGYNVGFNAGATAGQTVMHLHVHVIPRYEGDVPDPRGGVRHVILEEPDFSVPTLKSLWRSGFGVAGSSDRRPRRKRNALVAAERIEGLARRCLEEPDLPEELRVPLDGTRSVALWLEHRKLVAASCLLGVLLALQAPVPLLLLGGLLVLASVFL